MGEGRFRTFTTGYKETDLWIGIDPDSFQDEMKVFCFDRIKFYRTELENYLAVDPEYGLSLKPYQTNRYAPELALKMAKTAQQANVGPMAAVAGAFAQQLGNDLMNNFEINVIAIENGGDVFLHLINPIIMSIFAGNSPLSGKIGIEIPGNTGSIGVCTSSGTVGPSLSFGKADAVMVACKDAALADAWATSLGNRVQTAEDIDIVLKFAEQIKEILSLVIICDGKVGIRGIFDLKLTK
jgi:ApbE superfamily uncharacterized protein (UPF0280 family)